jgi:hypothetical protein
VEDTSNWGWRLQGETINIDLSWKYYELKKSLGATEVRSQLFTKECHQFSICVSTCAKHIINFTGCFGNADARVSFFGEGAFPKYQFCRQEVSIVESLRRRGCTHAQLISLGSSTFSAYEIMISLGLFCQ